MSGLDQLQYLSWLLFVLIFLAVLRRTIDRPTPAHIDMTLFFGAVAAIIVLSTLTTRLHITQLSVLADVSVVLAISLGYLLLRLVRDFSHVPRLIMRMVVLGIGAAVVCVAVVGNPLPPTFALALVVYLVAVIFYSTWAFARHSARTRGVTRRRMQAASLGSLCLALVLATSGATVLVPAWAGMWAQASALLGLISGAAYFLGFAPPTWLRRAWQEPELRAFLARSAGLTRMPDTRRVVRELERGAADALGAPAASMLVWDADTRRLRGYARLPPPDFDGGDAQTREPDPAEDEIFEIDPTTRPLVGRSFVEHEAHLITNAPKTDPAYASILERYGARTVLAAPMAVGGKPMGTLLVYAPKAPVFANSDLELVQLLADQAAVILENRALIDEAARVRAREEAARLKEDFLSSAAHDLKTPLTGIVTQAQVLRRRAERDPSAPADPVGLDRLLKQSLRLRDLVLELLDVSRLERGSLVGERNPVDLGTVVTSVVEREGKTWQRVQLEAEESLVVALDVPRFEQVLTNLIENALKYSPGTKPVRVRLWLAEDAEARISVEDRGIGIPLQDQPLIFDRFHRAGNVDDRRFAGMGLGLYIARGIVEEHGGRIWVESTPGEGSTFHLALPVASESTQRPQLSTEATPARA